MGTPLKNELSTELHHQSPVYKNMSRILQFSAYVNGDKDRLRVTMSHSSGNHMPKCLGEWLTDVNLFSNFIFVNLTDILDL